MDSLLGQAMVSRWGGKLPPARTQILARQALGGLERVPAAAKE